MKVLIVATTFIRNGRAICAGGMALESGLSLRLLQADGSNQPVNCAFRPGQVWDMALKRSPWLEPPHIEDHLVQRKQLVGELPDLREYLLEHAPLWQGEPANLFDGCLAFTAAGSGYICRKSGLPLVSTGFWLTHLPFYRQNDGIKIRFASEDGTSLPYVGIKPSLPALPAATLVRVSLARWWKQYNHVEQEERCYLQLSGWYL